MLYEVRKGARFIFGAETLMPAVGGIDYSVISKILSAPGGSLREKARNIVLTGRNYDDVKTIKTPMSFSAVDTAAMAKLPKYLDPVARLIKGNPRSALFISAGEEPFRLDLKDAKKSNSTVDLCGLAKHLVATTSSADAKALRDFVQNELVVAHVEKNCGNLQSGSLSIELPYPNQYRADKEYKTIYPSLELSKDAQWNKLLQWISTLK